MVGLRAEDVSGPEDTNVGANMLHEMVSKCARGG